MSKKQTNIVNTKQQYFQKNVVNGRFYVASANLSWAVDFTDTVLKVDRKNRLVRLLVVTDLGTNEILILYSAYSMPAEDVTKMVVQKLKERLKDLDHNCGLILHTDRGTEFTSKTWSEIPTQVNNVVLSMSRGGKPTDNSIVERLNRTIKSTPIFKQMVAKSSTEEGFADLSAVSQFLVDLQQTHNMSYVSQRSLYLSPSEAYEAFKTAKLLLPLPLHPIVKNEVHSTKVDEVQLYRTKVVQIAQGRYNPPSADQTQFLISKTINDNVVKLAQVTGEKLNDITTRLTDIEQKVTSLQRKPKRKHVAQRPRDAFNQETMQLIYDKVLNSNTDIRELRNCIVVVLLEGSGLRCNETSQFSLNDLTQFVKARSFEILEPKTNQKRIIVISQETADCLKKGLASLCERLQHIRYSKPLGTLPLWANYKTFETMHEKSILRAVNTTIKKVLKVQYNLESVDEIDDLTAIPHVRSHSGRISFVTSLFELGIESTLVQEMVGHKKLDTTMRYSRKKLNIQEKLNILDKKQTKNDKSS